MLASMANLTVLTLSRVMRKPAFCICEKKDADQLRGSREADQRLCFRYTDSKIPLLRKSENFKLLAILCGYAAQFVSDLVGNPEDRFSQNEAHMLVLLTLHQGENQLSKLCLCCSQQFFSHVGTEPSLPGYYQYFWGVKFFWFGLV